MTPTNTSREGRFADFGGALAAVIIQASGLYIGAVHERWELALLLWLGSLCGALDGDGRIRGAYVVLFLAALVVLAIVTAIS